MTFANVTVKRDNNKVARGLTINGVDLSNYVTDLNIHITPGAKYDELTITLMCHRIEFDDEATS